MPQQRVMQSHECFFSFKGMQYRPLSVATEFMESEYDEEEINSGESDAEDSKNSPRSSISSVGHPSFTTVSSYDENQTASPCCMSTEMPSPLNLAQPIQGPHGPHLFRMSRQFMDYQDTLSLSPMTPGVPASYHRYSHVQTLENNNQPTHGSHDSISLPPPRQQWTHEQRGLFRFAEEELDIETLASWTPAMVAQHLLNADIEPEVCERFIENDITGNILVKLKLEDLKELGIISFGVRIKVWGQIKSLAIAKVVEQSVGPLSQDDFEREMYQAPHHDSDSPQNHDSNDISNDIGDESKTLLRRNNAQRRSTQAVADTIMPGESISIVGIEQMIPKPHQCSKGENCSKWRRNRRIMDDFKKAYPFVDTDKSGAFIVTGHPESGKTEAALRPSGVPLRLMTEMIPSVVASSDVLGPGEVNTSFALEERTLCAIQTQDPQENVRQFLEFQHQQAERFGEVPPTPPFELVPSRNQQPHKGLRMLPKLSIPVQPRKTNPVTSNNVFRVQQQQRSNSRSRHIPPLTSKAYPLSSETASAAPTSVTSYTNTAIEESPSLTALVPHRFGTPFSDVDVPVTAFPDDPIARNVSQSVPPNMSYRTPHIIPFPRASARRPSFPLLPALDENKATAAHPVTPRKLRNIASVVGCRPLYCSSTSNTAVQATDTALSDTAAAGCPQPPPRTKYSWSAERVIFEKGIAPLSLITSTFSSSPSSSLVPATRALSTPPSMSDVSASKASSVKGTSGADTTYQGDVKKRTTRMLRHEWNDRYVTLEGTRMAVHKDKASMHHAALEVIDIDDYAISCSAMAASTSKLNAAFKAMNIRRGNADSAQESKDDVAAFAFQLIPQDMKNGLRCKKRDTANPTDNDGSLLSSSSSTKSVSSLSLSASAAPLHAGTVNATGKTHHFAVKSRDDRIEWMRKLMLAKAMRQKGEGFEVSVNGNMV